MLSCATLSPHIGVAARCSGPLNGPSRPAQRRLNGAPAGQAQARGIGDVDEAGAREAFETGSSVLGPAGRHRARPWHSVGLTAEVSVFDWLKTIPLFSALSDEDLAVLAAEAEEISLEPGETLFFEGDRGDRAYVIAEGEVEILKRSASVNVLLARHGPGEIIGEISLLLEEPRSATVRACRPTRLVSIQRDRFQSLLETSAPAARAVFQVLLDRWRNTESKLRQNERMSQLATLTAGLAHELNNPMAAVQRAAVQLRDAVVAQGDAALDLGSVLSPDERAGVSDLVERVRRSHDAPLHGLARADAEDELGDWLTEQGVSDAWRLAGELVGAGFDKDGLAATVAATGGRLSRVLGVLAGEHHAMSLLHTIEEGSRRVSAIVEALKSFSYLDQAPVQDVDVVSGLEDTLLILGSKTTDVAIVKEYAADLPRIDAYGSELNQVWTNLIDNAIDAVQAGGGGVVTIRARPDEDGIVVEVEDDGPGIPDDIRHRIFDPFFTTKAPGQGTGLGLDIAYGIVVDRHRGEITVSSEPGRTTFRVRLPAGRASTGS
jgi:signal transduction histidine kinase